MRAPRDAELQYELACVHDYLGHESEAIGNYAAAIAGGLAGQDLRGAYLGLGSTYRALGRYAEALATFDEGLRRFGTSELRVFRAMALHNRGRHKEATAVLLRVLCETTSDPAIRGY